MSLEASIDAKGRVTLSGFAADSDVLKNGVLVASGVSEPWTDNQPQTNYKKVVTAASTYTFTGVEFAILGTQQYGVLDWTVTIDGVPYSVKANFQGIRNGTKYDEILWGISGLSNTEHTVVISIASGTYSLANLSGYWYSDLSVPFGDPITYSVGGSEVVVSPTPDKVGSAQADLDRWIAGYGDGVAFCNSFPGNSFLNEMIATVAGAYAMTGDTRLPAIASQMFDRLEAISGASTGILSSDNTLTDNGRTGYHLWYAYKAFGDSRYLDFAEKVVSTFLTTWVRDDNGIWNTSNVALDFEEEIAAAGNQRTAPALSCAVLYNEPASIYYGNAALKDLALANATYAVTGQIQANGEMYYDPTQGGNWAERLYGMFEWMHLRYLRDFCGWTTTNINAVEDWLNNIPQAEPYFGVRSIFYGHSQPSWSFLRIITEGENVDSGYPDLFFSAKYALTDETIDEYNPAGHAASTAPYSSSELYWLSGLPFYTAQHFQMLGVPMPGFDVPTTGVAGTFFTDAAGNQSLVHDSTGNPMTFYGGDGNPL